MWSWLVACAGTALLPDPASPETGKPLVLPSPVGIEVSLGTEPLGLADLAVDADGVVWVAWIAQDPEVENGRDVLVSRAVDGVSFEPPVRVDGPLEPTAVWPRIPRLTVAADGAILVAFTAVTRATEAIEVFRAAPGTLAFEHIFERERTAEDDAIELLLPIARSGPDGDVWVAWLASGAVTSELWAAREGEGWAERRVDGGDAEPACTCCPVDFLVSGGRALFVWRGGYRRELVVSEAVGSGYSPPREISEFGLLFLACPLDGPQLLGHDGQFEVIASDTDPGAEALWSIAEDAAGSWGAPVAIPGNPELGGRRPAVAEDGERVWLAYETDEGTRVASASDGVWGVGSPLVGMASVEPLRLASGPDRVWTVRVVEDGGVWVSPLSAGVSP